CISLPFHISFIANIARKRPELNRDKTNLNQSCIDAPVSQLSDKLSTATVAAGTIYACHFINAIKQVHG
ncbi:hypothetical protein N9381_12610, partial [Paracoccaceae bacterium]|nr:hypothetical protein [Paracoccaceae bacterium]